jgi:hypothetical protein
MGILGSLEATEYGLYATSGIEALISWVPMMILVVYLPQRLQRHNVLMLLLLMLLHDQGRQVAQPLCEKACGVMLVVFSRCVR